MFVAHGAAIHKTVTLTTALSQTGVMPLVNSDVSLRPMTPLEASNITAGNRPIAGWADDFPATGDKIAARLYSLAVATPTEPWRASWLIVVDGLVCGTIGFKGQPIENQLEVGYGVVPSQQGRGVATEALSKMLALVAGRGLSVRAETTAQNLASQAVLGHLGFIEVTRRHDPGEGEIIVWERSGSV